RYIDRYGFDTVEQFVDLCLSLEDLIDPYSVFMKRMPDERAPRPEEERGIEHRLVRYPAKDYMDRFINPPERLEAQRRRIKADQAKEKKAEPAKPTRDVLLYLLRHAPLEDWQADI